MADKAKDAAPETGSYAGENPHPKGSQAWHGWNYLQKTVKADRAKGMNPDKLPKGWTHPDHPDSE